MLLEELIELDEDWRKTAMAAGIGLGTALGAGAVISNAAHYVTAPKQAEYKTHSETMQKSAELIDKLSRRSDAIPYPEPKPDIQPLNPKDVKRKFISNLTPLVDKINADILAERKQVRAILKSGIKSSHDRQIIDALLTKYRADNPDDLLQRIDIIPREIAIAQAGLESGWGQSRLAKTGNVLYGQKTTGTNFVSSQSDRYAAFETPEDSVESYMRNLNSHPAYENFREVRAEQRKTGKLSVKPLVQTLTKYSTRGTEYVKHLMTVINDLDT